jgi:hypothetical protein
MLPTRWVKISTFLIDFVSVLLLLSSPRKPIRIYHYYYYYYYCCNVDDKALLANDSVKQRWKRSDRCYAMTKFTGVNNEGEDVFCVVGAVISLV